MVISRVVGAHFAAVFLGSMLLTVGINCVEHGPVGILDGAGKWIGGVLTWFVLVLLSLPVALFLRGIIGKLGQSPIRGAILGGTLVSLMLMFLLHPAMYPGVSFWTNPVALTLVHGFAGICGGVLWHSVEFGRGGEHVG